MIALGDDAPTPAQVYPTMRRPSAGHDDVFFAAVERADLPMVVTDPREADNPVVFANAAFMHMTGYPPDQVLRRNCRFLQGPETDAATVCAIGRALHECKAITVELVNHRHDGTPFWNALHISPVFGPGGELLYFFGSQLDVTRQRHRGSGAAPRAENGGRRAAHQRHRARLQQPADGDRREPRTDGEVGPPGAAAPPWP